MSDAITPLEYTIKTKAELAGALQWEASLEREIGKLKAQGAAIEDVAKKQAELDKARESIASARNSGVGGGSFMQRLKSDVGEVEGSFSQLRAGGIGSMEAIGKLAGTVAGPIGLIAVGVFAAGKAFELLSDGVEKFAARQVRVTDLKSALEGVGAATQQNIADIQEQAKAYQDLTNIPVDEWLSGIANVTRRTGEGFGAEELLDTLKSLAAVMRTDVGTASGQLAGYLNGNDRLAHKLGLTVDEVKDKHERLAKIQEELAKRAGKSLEDQTETLTGQFRHLKNETEELGVGLGRMVYETGLLTAVAGTLSWIVGGLNKLFPETAEAVGKLNNRLPTLAGGIGDAADEMNQLGTAADGATRGVKATGDAAKEAGEKFQQSLSEIEKYIHAHNQLTDAQMTAELSAVDADEAKGPHTPAAKAAADAKRLAIRQAAAKRIQDAEAFGFGLRQEEIDIKSAQTKSKGAASAAQQAALENAADTALNPLIYHLREKLGLKLANGLDGGDLDRVQDFLNKQREANKSQKKFLKNEWDPESKGFTNVTPARAREIVEQLGDLAAQLRAIEDAQKILTTAAAAGVAAAKGRKAALDAEVAESAELTDLAKKQQSLDFEAAGLEYKKAQTENVGAAGAANISREQQEAARQERIKALEAKGLGLENQISGGGLTGGALTAALDELTRVQKDLARARLGPDASPADFMKLVEELRKIEIENGKRILDAITNPKPGHMFPSTPNPPGPRGGGAGVNAQPAVEAIENGTDDLQSVIQQIASAARQGFSVATSYTEREATELRRDIKTLSDQVAGLRRG